MTTRASTLPWPPPRLRRRRLQQQRPQRPHAHPRQPDVHRRCGAPALPIDGDGTPPKWAKGRGCHHPPQQAAATGEARRQCFAVGARRNAQACRRAPLHDAGGRVSDHKCSRREALLCGDVDVLVWRVNPHRTCAPWIDHGKKEEGVATRPGAEPWGKRANTPHPHIEESSERCARGCER